MYGRKRISGKYQSIINFWSDRRKQVRNSFKDLELFLDTARESDSGYDSDTDSTTDTDTVFDTICWPDHYGFNAGSTAVRSESIKGWLTVGGNPPSKLISSEHYRMGIGFGPLAH